MNSFVQTFTWHHLPPAVTVFKRAVASVKKLTCRGKQAETHGETGEKDKMKKTALETEQAREEKKKKKRKNKTDWSWGTGVWALSWECLGYLGFWEVRNSETTKTTCRWRLFIGVRRVKWGGGVRGGAITSNHLPPQNILMDLCDADGIGVRSVRKRRQINK